MGTITAKSSPNVRISERQRHIERKQSADFLAESADFIKNVLRSLLTDLSKTLGHRYSSAEFTRDLNYLDRRLSREGVSFALLTLPCLADGLLSWHEHGCNSYDFPFFKKTSYGYPVFLRRIFAIAFNDNDADQQVAFDWIYQFSVSFKKLKGPFNSSDLAEQVLKFVKTDRELGLIDFDSDHLSHILEYSVDDIDKIFRHFKLDTFGKFVPRPGPGSTNTPVVKTLRYRPNVIFKSLEREFQAQEWFYSHPWMPCLDSKQFLSLHKMAKDLPHARLACVDKKYGVARIICLEENEAQYLQQAFKNAVYYQLENHPITRGKVNFTLQSINRELAHESSVTLQNGTLDMSEGSDRHARYLVEKHFVNQPEILSIINALCTRVIDIPKKYRVMKGIPSELKCNKFAPMGSALCFPFMSLIHFVLIRAIIRASTLDNSFCDSVYIYGDDIVVPSQAVQAIYDWLPQFGMKFNQTKSYYKSHFRESCGLHAFKGKVVTPVYFKYAITSSLTTKALQSLIANERDLHKKGYVATASCVRSCVERLSGRLPYVSLRTSCLGWMRDKASPSTLIYHQGYRKRFNDELYRPEYRVKVFKTRPQMAYITEQDAYLSWLVNRSGRSVKHVRPVSAHINGLTIHLHDDITKGTSSVSIRPGPLEKGPPCNSLHEIDNGERGRLSIVHEWLPLEAL